MTDADQDDVEKASHHFAALMAPTLAYLTAIMTAGLTGNTIVFIVYYKQHKPSSIRSYILIMCVLDLLINTLAVPKDIMFRLRFDWTWVNDRVCQGFVLAKSSLLTFSGFILVSVSLDRHRTVCRPSKRPLPVKRALAFCVLGTFVTASPAVYVAGKQTITVPDTNVTGASCFIADSVVDTPFLDLYNVASLTMCSAASAVMCVAYGLIALHLNKHAKRMMAHSLKSFKFGQETQHTSDSPSGTAQAASASNTGTSGSTVTTNIGTWSPRTAAPRLSTPRLDASPPVFPAVATSTPKSETQEAAPGVGSSCADTAAMDTVGPISTALLFSASGLGSGSAVSSPTVSSPTGTPSSETDQPGTASPGLVTSTPVSPVDSTTLSMALPTLATACSFVGTSVSLTEHQRKSIVTPTQLPTPSQLQEGLALSVSKKGKGLPAPNLSLILDGGTARSGGNRAADIPVGGSQMTKPTDQPEEGAGPDGSVSEKGSATKTKQGKKDKAAPRGKGKAAGKSVKKVPSGGKRGSKKPSVPQKPQSSPPAKSSEPDQPHAVDVSAAVPASDNVLPAITKQSPASVQKRSSLKPRMSKKDQTSIRTILETPRGGPKKAAGEAVNLAGSSNLKLLTAGDAPRASRVLESIPESRQEHSRRVSNALRPLRTSRIYSYLSITGIPLSASESSWHRQASGSLHVSKVPHRTTLMMFILTVIFVVNFFPHLIFLVVFRGRDVLPDVSAPAQNLYQIIQRSYYFNSAANSLVYFACSGRFRRECMMLFSGQPQKSSKAAVSSSAV